MASLDEIRAAIDKWHEHNEPLCEAGPDGKCCVDKILDEIYTLDHSEFSAFK